MPAALARGCPQSSRDLRPRLEPLPVKPRLSASAASENAFRSPLVLSRVHWVEPKLVAEITYLTGPPIISCDTRCMSGEGGQAGRSGAADATRPN